eukprot:TRINITY_DN22943_c0_g1_i4.p1 TRINITY_DN22943_c0_g1~~TRINITY_DN22943_c0_g1_i4.p1  ORF type:complete len:140 (+),score=25.02 TRINITY_DN22943_c0_g1_i4:165-584(+)
MCIRDSIYTDEGGCWGVRGDTQNSEILGSVAIRDELVLELNPESSSAKTQECLEDILSLFNTPLMSFLSFPESFVHVAGNLNEIELKAQPFKEKQRRVNCSGSKSLDRIGIVCKKGLKRAPNQDDFCVVEDGETPCTLR